MRFNHHTPSPSSEQCADPLKRRSLKAGLLGITGLAIGSALPSVSLAKAPDVNSNTPSKSAAGSNLMHWDEPTYQAILSRIKAPQFPNKDFNITDYGAKANQDITKAVAKAIQACHNAGGGRVVIPAGTYHTGAIHLLSNVNLYIAKNATLLFSTDQKDYPNVLTRFEGTELINSSPLIYAYKQTNIAVTGEGTVDGQASTANWWAWKDKSKPKPYGQDADANKLLEMADSDVPVKDRVFGRGHHLRPCFIEPHTSSNILIEGITIKNSPMWEIHPTLSQNITIRNVTIESHGPNNDGCDPECCKDVLIEGCKFNTGDDCIAIKSGKNHDGRRVNQPSDGIIIRNCKMLDGHGGVVMGSECSGHIRHVFIEDCDMSSKNLQRALRFKDNAVRGGHIEHIYMRNTHVGTVLESFLTIDLHYAEGANGKFMPVIQDIHITGIQSDNSPRIMFIVSFEGAVLDQIHFEDCHFKNTEFSDVIDVSGEITMKNVQAIPKTMTKSLGTI
ncbi:glycoside hydrolase family 28 protein [Celerinatantimonas sp. YJH-8]|uniref:glycoside hydrolase family 28 protein n=1 Tax=Celerinatantimonas sp. YJH-8 TaxID=3228714 RepID=UPI0038C45A60